MILHSCQVILSETIEIPPHSEFIAPANVENPLLNGKVVMLEVNPNFVKKHEVLVPKILVGVE